MTASTANSGSVWSHARIASASPCETRNWAASAAHAIMTAEPRTVGKVHKAEAAPVASVATAAAGRARNFRIENLFISLCLPEALCRWRFRRLANQSSRLQHYNQKATDLAHWQGLHKRGSERLQGDLAKDR